jgi:CubicO group peptidase (beta-lactamase class C family)
MARLMRVLNSDRSKTVASTGIACAIPLALAIAQTTLSRVDPSAVALDGARLREATTLLEQFVADGTIAGAVAAVARNGRLAYLQAVGVQDLETRVPMSERSLFRIYSMTRPITATAVMMLHQERRFQLDDPVSRYIPDFERVTVAGAAGAAPRQPARPITIRDLLLHTSGINDRNSEPYRAAQVRSRTISMSAFLDNVIRVPLMEDPGTRFRYGESTTVLGRLVEVWSKQSFDGFLETRVFKPLGMVDTVFVVDESRRSRLATVYTPNKEGGGLTPRETETLPFTERPQLIEGTVGLVSSVPDYLRFCQMLLNRGELGGVRVLEPETVDAMTSNGLSPEIMALRGGVMGWALGNVNVMTDKSSPLYGEYGWDGTAGTIFWNDPARQMVTMVWTQSQPANPDGIRQKFKALVQTAIPK